MHRTASAVIEANTYNAAYAVMLVHSFSPDHAHWEAFDAFVNQYGKTAARGQLVELTTLGTIRLWVGWVQGDARYLSQ